MSSTAIVANQAIARLTRQLLKKLKEEYREIVALRYVEELSVAEIAEITDKGKIYKFDSIECLVEYALEQNILGDEKQTFLVTDFSNPLKLVDAKSAFYVHNDNIRSPMGLNVSAFGNESDMQKFFSDNNGRKIIWLDVIEMIKLSSM